MGFKNLNLQVISTHLMAAYFFLSSEFLHNYNLQLIPFIPEQVTK